MLIVLVGKPFKGYPFRRGAGVAAGGFGLLVISVVLVWRHRRILRNISIQSIFWALDLLLLRVVMLWMIIMPMMVMSGSR